MSEIRTVTKVSLFEAATSLAAICRKIEDGEELDSLILEEFGATTTQLAESIDRRKAFYGELNSKLELAKNYKKEIDVHMKRLKNVQERLKKVTMDTMAGAPDLPFKDSLGRKLTLCQTPAFLKLTFEMSAPRTFSILDPDSISFIGLPDKYIKEISFLTLDTDQIKADLQSGETLPYAKLQTTTYLRGL